MNPSEYVVRPDTMNDCSRFEKKKERKKKEEKEKGKNEAKKIERSYRQSFVERNLTKSQNSFEIPKAEPTYKHIYVCVYVYMLFNFDANQLNFGNGTTENGRKARHLARLAGTRPIFITVKIRK